MKRPEDYRQRLQALDVSASCIVQAPAGSGKTELLIRRYLTLLGTVTEPEQVLAITFTRKAAAEMRGRVIEQLRLSAAARPEDPFKAEGWELGRRVLEQSDRHQWQLLMQPSRLRVQTIDSFSQGLSSALPLLAGSGVSVSPVDDADRLYRQAAEQLLAEVEGDYGATAELLVLLRYLDNRADQLLELLVEMLGKRDQWLKLLPAEAGFDLFAKQMEQLLARNAETELQRLVTLLGQSRCAELVELVEYARGNLIALVASGDNPDKAARLTRWAEQLAPTGASLASALALDYWQGVLGLLLTTNGALRIRIDKWCGFPADSEVAKATKQRMVELLASLRADESLLELLARVALLPSPQLTGEDVELLRATAVVLKYAAAELQLVFQRSGEADFSELALRALQALENEQGPTDLALALDYRIQHILVDEFQDTSWLQYRLLEYLTRGWQPGDGRTLFLVGDPMQSIYRFREADVGLFLRSWMRPIGAIQLNALQLSANFRSDQKLIEANNRVFAKLFPQHQDIGRGAVAFAASSVVRDGHASSGLYCHGLVENASSSRTARQVEASLLVEQVKAMDQSAAEDAGSSNSAILVNSRSHLVEILPLLRASAIPFQAVELQPLATSGVLLDLLAITRALLHPADRVAWIALLHGPCVGLRLSDITLLLEATARSQPLPALLHEGAVSNRLSTAGQQRLACFNQAYDRIRQRPWLRLSLRVESLWLALAGPLVVNEESELRDAERYFEILDQAERRERLLTPSLLDQLIAREYAGSGGGDVGGLQVMTVHKSKGLQFDQVFLPGLDRTGRTSSAPLLAWEEHSSQASAGELLLAPVRSPYRGNHPIYTYINSLEKERDRQEQLRLLYVALTRARHQVHLFAQLQIDDEGNIKTPSANSALARLWPMLEKQFVASVSNGTDISDNESQLPVDQGTQWRSIATGVERPVLPGSLFLGDQRPVNDVAGEIEYDWAGDEARVIGLLVHRHLCRLSRLGAQQWNDYLRQHGERYADQLHQYGLPETSIEFAAQSVARSLQRCVDDPRGRWLLVGGLSNQSEYALTRWQRGVMRRFVIDRTFIDQQGVRWIVDYKTGYRAGSDVEGFLDQEQQRYQDQLQGYAELFRQLETLPVKLGLYFPRMGGWREWTPA